MVRILPQARPKINQKLDAMSSFGRLVGFAIVKIKINLQEEDPFDIGRYDTTPTRKLGKIFVGSSGSL